MRTRSINSRNNSQSATSNAAQQPVVTPQKPATDRKPKAPAQKPATKPVALTAEQQAAATAVNYIYAHLKKDGVARLEVVKDKKEVCVFVVDGLDKKDAGRARFSINQSAKVLGMEWHSFDDNERGHYSMARKAWDAAEQNITHLTEVEHAAIVFTSEGATKPAADKPAPQKPSDKPAEQKPTTNRKPKAPANTPAANDEQMITLTDAKKRCTTALKKVFGANSMVTDEAIARLVNAAFAI